MRSCHAVLDRAHRIKTLCLDEDVYSVRCQLVYFDDWGVADCAKNIIDWFTHAFIIPYPVVRIRYKV